tara:strand:+ start:1250 stop:1516 length:267 start_codon:yes stop_codon:yes gene_type:complete
MIVAWLIAHKVRPNPAESTPSTNNVALPTTVVKQFMTFVLRKYFFIIVSVVRTHEGPLQVQRLLAGSEVLQPAYESVQGYSKKADNHL